MSKQTLSRPSKSETRLRAVTFAALGDETRLRLLGKLAAGRPQSIKELTVGLSVTRQAVTKHLRVLEAAKFVEQHPHGRERRFVAREEGINEAQRALTSISLQWEDALLRLKSFVEQ